MKSIVILISGRGSNMLTLLDAVANEQVPARIAAVLSNRPDAEGLALAAERGVPVEALDHRGYPDRASFDLALAARIDAYAPDLVVLAGFMRILSDDAERLTQGRPALADSEPELALAPARLTVTFAFGPGFVARASGPAPWRRSRPRWRRRC